MIWLSGLVLAVSLGMQLLFTGPRSAAACGPDPELVSVSGKITDDRARGLPGVQLELSPEVPEGRTVVTGADGTYAIKVRKGWTGRVTPKATGCTIYTPASRAYTNVSADQSNQDYQSGYRTVVISGRVTDSSGKGIPGVTIRGLTVFTGTSYVTVTTGPDGCYRHVVMCGFSHPEVKPVKPGHDFSPVSRGYVHVTADMSNQDYRGVRQSR